MTDQSEMDDCMFKKDNWFIGGWVYLVVMFILEMVLPPWMGDENGPIENLQVLCLIAGFYYCCQIDISRLSNWRGNAESLLKAGKIYFFLLIMREISWGRVLLTHPDGSHYEYSEMGFFGQMVHPMVAVLIVILLLCLWRAKVWRFLLMVKIPVRSFLLLLIFIFMSWLGEKANFTGFHGAVAEELAEFGAYMMMLYLLRYALKAAQKTDK